MMKKSSLVICLLLAISLMIMGCSGQAAPTTAKTEQKTEAKTDAPVVETEAPVDETEAPVKDLKDIKLGFVGMTLNNEFHITLANGAKAKAEEMGVSIDVQAGDQHASADAQLQIVENYLQNNVDGLLIVPSSSEGLITALQKAKEAGVPIINLDTRINQDVLDEVGLEVPFYGTDNRAGAKMAGEYVAANFGKGTKTAILTGIEGHQNATDRREGFIEGAGEHIEVVAEQTGNWEVDQGYTATQNIIVANPDLELIFASNDGMAIGALRAVEEANLKDQIKIIGFDAISEALNLVKEGDLLGTVAQFPAKMGDYGVVNIINMIQGKSFEQYIDTGTAFITSENVDEQIEYVSQFVD